MLLPLERLLFLWKTASVLFRRYLSPVLYTRPPSGQYVGPSVAPSILNLPVSVCAFSLFKILVRKRFRKCYASYHSDRVSPKTRFWDRLLTVGMSANHRPRRARDSRRSLYSPGRLETDHPMCGAKLLSHGWLGRIAWATLSPENPVSAVRLLTCGRFLAVSGGCVELGPGPNRH